jgi:hypothetical protein
MERPSASEAMTSEIGGYMAFKYVPEKSLSVEDDATGATLSMVLFFKDANVPFYKYKQGEIEFEFPITVAYETRLIETKQGPTQQKVQVAAYVNWRDVERQLALARFIQRLPPVGGVHDDLRRSIREGLFLLLTNGGVLLKFVPDFKVIDS